jgi:hypothetical protein
MGLRFTRAEKYINGVCILDIGHSPEAIRGRPSPAAAGLRYRLPARLPLARVRASSFFPPVSSVLRHLISD